MKAITETVTNTIYQSECLAKVHTLDPLLARTIAWADSHPVAWRVVTEHRSKAFGRGSCEYIGWAQKSMEPSAIFERVHHFHELVSNTSPYHNEQSIFVWRARFTMEHYQDKGFKGGFFQQHDAKYPRSCLTLDYTPETLQEVLDKFCAWIDQYHDTQRITLNGTTVRTFAGKENNEQPSIAT